MLQSIRDHTQGWIAGVIISILILSFALWGIHSYIGGGNGDTSVAKVNGTEITKSQLSIAYERLRRQLQLQYNSNGGIPEQAEVKLKSQALQTLINIQILSQASLAQNYLISSRQVESFLESMPEFQENGQFSVPRFQQLLEKTLFNTNDFLELIRVSLLIDQPRLGLIFTSFALPNEITSNMALINQERDIQYAVLPTEFVLKQPIVISAEKIQAYYDQHKDQFKTPEQISIEYIELSLKDLMTGINPTDDVLKTFYTENSSSYAQPMQWKLESILIPLSENATKDQITQAEAKVDQVLLKAKAGTDFATLTRELILEKGDEKLQNWVSINQTPVELQKVILTLNKTGQIANPVKTNKGFVILKAMAIKPAVAQSFEQTKNKVMESYIRQQAEEKFASSREKLANVAYEHPESLEPAANALGLKVNSSELFSQEKADKGIATNKKIREAAFSNDVLNLQNNSEVIPSSNDSVVVIRVKTHVPATLLPLKAVQNQIVDKLKTTEAEIRSAQLANEIKEKLQSGNKFSQVLQQYHLIAKQVGFIGRHSNKVASAILDAAFAMPKPQTNKSTYATAKVPEGYAIISLQAVRTGAMSSSKHDQYQVFAEQVQNTQGLMEYELYKLSLVKQAKVVIGS